MNVRGTFSEVAYLNFLTSSHQTKNNHYWWMTPVLCETLSPISHIFCNLNARFCFSGPQTHSQRGPSCYSFASGTFAVNSIDLVSIQKNGKHWICNNNYISFHGSYDSKPKRRVVVIGQIHQKGKFILKTSFCSGQVSIKQMGQ